MNRLILVFLLCFIATSCSVPVLESAACRESRDALIKVYSTYLDAEDKKPEERIDLIKQHLTEEVFKAASKSEGDYFTHTKDLPSAARINTCQDGGETMEMVVSLFVKQDADPYQSTVTVRTRKKNDVWLIESVKKDAK